MHGLQAAVTVVSLPSWQLASSRGVCVESTESVQSPCGVHASPHGLARNTGGRVKTSGFQKVQARPKPTPGQHFWLGLAWPVWPGLAWLLA